MAIDDVLAACTMQGSASALNLADELRVFHGRGLVAVISLQGEESELLHHVANLNAVDSGIIPAATVWGLFTSTLPEHGDQLLIVAAAAGCIIEGFIVANPEGDIPGLPVCPSVEGRVHGVV